MARSLIRLPRWYLVVIVMLVEKEEIPRLGPVPFPFVQRTAEPKEALDLSYALLRMVFFDEENKKFIAPDGNAMKPLCHFYYELPEEVAKTVQEDHDSFETGEKSPKKKLKKKPGKVLTMRPKKDKKDPPKK